MALFILLLVVAYFDYRQRRIPFLCIAIGLFYWGARIIYQGFFCETLQKEQIVGDVFSLMIIVVICIIMRSIWKECMGVGDVLLLGMMTLVGGRKTIIGSLIFTFMFLFGVSIILLVKGHSKKATVPFAPFLLMGYLTWLLITYY
ncbi:MAG: prepilin peptidase [Lachnospiraceae bacterium]|nr:prepilin peptidase [Lachnospiraceae bacterium]